MREYISTFTTGFNGVIQKALPLSLPGVKVIHVYNGLIHYSYQGLATNVTSIPYFNNTFYVIRRYSGINLNFFEMAEQLHNNFSAFPQTKGTFRVRFSCENRFEHVNKRIVSSVENKIAKTAHLSIDRVNPKNEFWFIIRSEGVGFFAQLLEKRHYTEKNLEKGELRPEFAFLMSVYANLKSTDVACDPFAGYGAIPLQLVRNFTLQHIRVNELDKRRYRKLLSNTELQNSNVSITNEDALLLTSIASHSVDVIITDPPWGYYEDVGDITAFYTRMFHSFKRILKYNGKAIILSARKQELTNAAQSEEIVLIDQISTLVNGKKASLTYFQVQG